MKKIKSFAGIVALLGSLTLVNQAVADPPVTNVVISTFDNFTPDSIYASWGSGTINSTPTSYVVTASGFGGLYKWIGYLGLNATAYTNVELDVTLSSSDPSASGALGPIVNITDNDGSEYSYRWYCQTLGHHILNMPLLTPNYTNAAGTTPGLDLANLQHLNIQLDAGGFSGTYSVSLNNLRLTGAVTDTCAQNVTMFSNFHLDAAYGNWASATIVTNTQGYQITASGYGSGDKGLPVTIDASGNTNIELTVNLSSSDSSASGKLGAIVWLWDADGTVLHYAWYGQTLGEHVLTLPLSAGTPDGYFVGTVPGFDFTKITKISLLLDPSSFTGTYTVAWEDLDFTGCASTAPVVITAQSYDPATGNFTLTWTSAAGKTYSILTATNLAGGFTTNTTGISSGGSTTTTNVTMPVSSSGFLRVLQQ